jgi:CHAD domain-containing protein
MPRFEKWLKDVPLEAPVSRVGRRAIAVRLAAVGHYLRQATNDPSERKSIHQLRIWTRRSAAALRLFEPLVPKRRGRAIRKTLIDLRRAAGKVRDCDVFLDRLTTGDREAPLGVVKRLKRRRRKVRRQLRAFGKELLKNDRFERQVQKLLARLDWPKRHSSRQSPPFAAWCRVRLVPMAQRFFALSAADFSQAEQFHDLRIAGKRLRYALELAPAAMPARQHQRLYEALSDLQQRLGEVCDHLVSVDRLERWQKNAKPRHERQVLKAAGRREARQLAAKRRQFLRWWSPARRRSLRRLWDSAVGRRR